MTLKLIRIAVDGIDVDDAHDVPEEFIKAWMLRWWRFCYSSISSSKNHNFIFIFVKKIIDVDSVKKKFFPAEFRELEKKIFFR